MEWIKCSEHLPAVGIDVLGLFKIDGEQAILIVSFNATYDRMKVKPSCLHYSEYNSLEITHWKLLPKLPKG
ncbi:DUF551 domain-containing protein [Pasteurellaceae bacterium TAE3-ERU1]|nr:DUF551 domain-containing protein [Pasteurellaceae bacterium TAE3-ERU1]